jgi:hypothetical protein
MYLVPPAGAPLLFGNIFSPTWLFDAVVNRDAIQLAEVSMRGGIRGYAPLATQAPKPGKDFVLAHGESCRAVLLADDCEIESCLVRKGGRGRLLFAALSDWPADDDEAVKAKAMTTFRRHPLEPDDHFDGGIVELQQLFAVSGRALTEIGDEDRVAALDDAGRAQLEQRWAAFATRRGPLAAIDNAAKLAHLLDAGDDVERLKAVAGGAAVPGEAPAEAAKAVARAFTQAWKAEGEVMQGIADAHEDRAPGQDAVAQLEEALRTLADFAAGAADALHYYRAA